MWGNIVELQIRQKFFTSDFSFGQLRASCRLWNLKCHHAQCEEHYDEAKKKIYERERLTTFHQIE